jgi:hypothetical protein
MGARAEDIFLWENGAAVEPWPEPVSGKALLDALVTELNRYVVLGMWAAETLALWIVHTYAYQLRDVTTYIGLESPEKRCGKTTLLSVLSELVNRPVVASNISSPAFFRVIEEKQPTLMIDEADTILHGNDQLRGILNAGYRRQTAYVVRVAPQEAEERAQRAEEGDEKPEVMELRQGSRLARFSCWCPKAIATIRHLPETLADRCIVIGMQRKTPREKCERLKKLQGEELRRTCARFVMDHRKEISEGQPEIPADLNDRAADIWEPLLVLAELAGGEWPERARNAALGLTARAQEDSPIGALLLDLMVMFVRAGNGRAFSRELAAGLNSYGERPWMALRNGKAVTELWLAQLLRPYGVRPKTIWIGDEAAKGYLEEDFTETFRRYIPKSAFAALVADSKAARQPEKKGSGTN